MDFLREVIKRNRRILHLRDVLLLLLRTAAVVLFVLAMARPYWLAGKTEAAGDVPMHAVLVIDKDRGKQALSEHEPWERWFAPEELAVWLGNWCEDVSVARVSHTEGRPGHDLFLSAEGTRRQ